MYRSIEHLDYMGYTSYQHPHLTSQPHACTQAEITKIQGAMMNLEAQAMSLEGSATNMEVFGAMRQGAKTMGAMRQNM